MSDWRVGADPGSATFEAACSFFGELKWIAKDRGYDPAWADLTFRDVFGQWPKEAFADHRPAKVVPSAETLLWVQDRQAAWRDRRNAELDAVVSALDRSDANGNVILDAAMVKSVLDLLRAERRRHG